MRKFGVLLALTVSVVGGWLSCTDPQPSGSEADMTVRDLRPILYDMTPSAIITVQDDYYSPQEVTIPAVSYTHLDVYKRQSPHAYLA